MRGKNIIFSVLVTVALAAGLVFWVLTRLDTRLDSERIGFQDAAAPLGMQTSELDFRVLSLSPWEIARVPVAQRFDFPMGSEHGALTYNAQPFLEMNEARGGPHLGDDLNGIGGQNSDQGDAVRACADGLVVYLGTPSPSWGNVVIVAHQTTDGKLLQSMYAHLEQILVARGSIVARGEILGTVGTANGNYLAHLHLELRESRGVDIGGGYGSHPLNRINPIATITKLRHAAVDDLAISPLPGIRDSFKPAWTGVEIGGAAHIPGLQSD